MFINHTVRPKTTWLVYKHISFIIGVLIVHFVAQFFVDISQNLAAFFISCKQLVFVDMSQWYYPTEL